MYDLTFLNWDSTKPGIIEILVINYYKLVFLNQEKKKMKVADPQVWRLDILFIELIFVELCFYMVAYLVVQELYPLLQQSVVPFYNAWSC